MLWMGKSAGVVAWGAARDGAMAAPPKIPRAPGGCQSGRALVYMSGPMSVSGRSERMDSMGEWEGLGVSGLMRVEYLDILGRRNDCCRGAKGTMKAGRNGGLVLQV